MDGVTLDVHMLLYAALMVVLGFQAVNFAVFTKIFAVTQGLLPEDPRLTRLFRVITLEVGATVGAVLVAIGLAASAWAFFSWSAGSYGPLEPVRALRVVIPAVLALTLGFQIILSSCFLSVPAGAGRGLTFRTPRRACDGRSTRRPDRLSKRCRSAAPA